MVALVRHTTVLHKRSESESTHWFGDEHNVRHEKVRTHLFDRPMDEPGDFPLQVRVENDRWLELGSPQTITVTIEPGDQLNDPGALNG